MSDLNSITVTGNLTADAVVKTIPSGKQVTSFSVGNNIGFGNNASTNFFEINLWGDSGSKVAPYLRKGSKVGITGTLKIEKWSNPSTGVTASKAAINTNSVVLLGEKKGDTQSIGNVPMPSAFDDSAFKAKYSREKPVYDDITDVEPTF
jgi:single-strand DNA-binding protein